MTARPDNELRDHSTGDLLKELSDQTTTLVKQFITTTNETQRAQQWPVIQQKLMDQTPVINVMNLPFVNAHRSNVCGTSVNALGVDHLENTWIAGAGG